MLVIGDECFSSEESYYDLLRLCMYLWLLSMWVYASFLPRIVDSLASLLHNGADRDPEIIEQVQFSFISFYDLRLCISGF